MFGAVAEGAYSQSGRQFWRLYRPRCHEYRALRSNRWMEAGIGRNILAGAESFDLVFHRLRTDYTAPPRRGLPRAVLGAGQR
jgi:hypothetical protein